MKRWLRWILIFVGGLTLVYAVGMRFVPDSQHFEVRRVLPYGMKKVVPQFRNLQNFTGWNTLLGSRDYTYTYYAPYEGAGSSARFEGTDRRGDLTIRYEVPGKRIRYFLQDLSQASPYVIDVQLRSLGPSRTEVRWKITTPRVPYLQRYQLLFSENRFSTDLDQSIRTLGQVLSNKVDQQNYLTNLKTDSLMIEQQKPVLLLGLSASTTNKKENILNSLLLNHDRLMAFLTGELRKKEDEYGRPMILFKNSDPKDKEISYFYGVPVMHKIKISDNNYTMRQLPARRTLTIYFKGNYANRTKVLAELKQKAKKDSLQSGELEETLLSPLSLDEETAVKISLPVRP